MACSAESFRRTRAKCAEVWDLGALFSSLGWVWLAADAISLCYAMVQANKQTSQVSDSLMMSEIDKSHR